MKYISYDHFFLVLGNTQRVRILQILLNEGPMNVTQMAEQLKGKQSNISHDMRRLLLCHFVVAKRLGKERIYSVNEETVKPIFSLIERHIKRNCVKGCVHWE